MTIADSAVVYESDGHRKWAARSRPSSAMACSSSSATSRPRELHDISVLHQAEVAEDGPQTGDLIQIGDTDLEVLAVGPVVRDNLLNLGHLDLKADGRTEPKLPGDVCVREGDLPLPRRASQRFAHHSSRRASNEEPRTR